MENSEGLWKMEGGVELLRMKIGIGNSGRYTVIE
jgi:hypothetical protein